MTDQREQLPGQAHEDRSATPLSADQIHAFVRHAGRLADRMAALPAMDPDAARDRHARIARLRAAQAAGLYFLASLPGEGHDSRPT